MPQPDFDEFFLKEYDRISEAYFKTTAMISEFMRHYLTIVSVAPTLAVLFTKPTELSEIGKFFRAHPFLGSMPFMAVAVAGFFIARYLVALSLNARVYARTVNGIRAHFVSGLAADSPTRRLIVLPLETNLPSFRRGTIDNVLWAMALVNAAYAAVSVFIFNHLAERSQVSALWLIPPIVFGAHFGARMMQVEDMEKVWGKDKHG